MGLSGRKTKQRIGADPRNLTWADDAAKFGSAYLTKMGWNPSQGLGVEGDGRTSHIKVAQKLNLLGIGAGAQQGDKEGIAWRQNRDFEVLLKRLNEAQVDEGEEEREKEKTEENGVAERQEEKMVMVSEEAEEVEGMKRKRKKDRDGDEKKEKKKRKKDKLSVESDGAGEEKEKKKKKKKRESEDDKESKNETNPTIAETPKSSQNIDKSTPSSGSQTPIPRPKAHRARFLKSKQLASRSSSAVAEILGISASNSSSSTPGASGSNTPLPKGQQKLEGDQELTTATQSVAEYFKAKLAARKLGRLGAASGVGDGKMGEVSLGSSPLAREVASGGSGPIVGGESRIGSGIGVGREVDDVVEESHAGIGSRSSMYPGIGGGKGGGSETRERVASELTGEVGVSSTPTFTSSVGIKFGGLMGGVSVVAPVASPHEKMEGEEGRDRTEQERVVSVAAVEGGVMACDARVGGLEGVETGKVKVKKVKEKKSRKEKAKVEEEEEEEGKGKKEGDGKEKKEKRKKEKKDRVDVGLEVGDGEERGKEDKRKKKKEKKETREL